MGRNENYAELSVSFTDGRSVNAYVDDVPRITTALMTHLCEAASRGLNGEAATGAAITVTDSAGAEVTLTTEQAYALAIGLLRGVSEITSYINGAVPDPSLN